MRLRLPFCLRFLCLNFLLASAASASYLHADVSLMSYTDFGQNCGRYTVGTANALLTAIRTQEQGIVLRNAAGEVTSAIPLTQGMIDFGSSSDTGSVTAVGVNYLASAYHVYTDTNLRGRYNPTFTADKLGAGQAIHYASVQYAHPNQTDGSKADFCLTRLSKVVTDVRTYEMATVSSGTISVAGGITYRAGSGVSYQMDEQGQASYLCNDAYTVGSMNAIDGFGVDEDYSKDIILVQCVTDWSAAGAGVGKPLPAMAANYDSGSGNWVFNAGAERYEYLAAVQGVSTEDSLTQSMGAPVWAEAQMQSHEQSVQAAAGARLELGVVTGGTQGEVSYQGVASGQQTWASLNGEMNEAAWYAYSNDYLNGFNSGETAYLLETQNLVFTAAAGATGDKAVTLQLEATVDLGIGYAQFSRSGDAADFVICSGGDGNALFNHAGYVIDAGVNVHVQLSNGTDYAREWRKIGEGNLYIEGSGDNYIGLNLGGSGTTYLRQQKGYAAYNVLANTGAVVVLQDVNQIARDFTFGNGGGVLDFNGKSMVWNNSAAVAEDGFTIHALTEEAVIANHGSAASTLTITDAGSSFLGSFQDSATGALKVVYQGAGTLEWHGIVTDLTASQDSGLTVASGTLSLSGVLTQHGQGSADGRSAARAVREDDWHYADAAADVSVKEGATFELGSHARLQGKVSVESGGVFVMHEGVLHAEEYIEGGEIRESTAAIRAFYGLQGDVELAARAVMRADISATATTKTVYGGVISGDGALEKCGGGTLVLTGKNTYTGGTVLREGVLTVDNGAALGSGSLTVLGGTLNMAASAEVRLESLQGCSELTMGGTTLKAIGTTESVAMEDLLVSSDGKKLSLKGVGEDRSLLSHVLLDVAEGSTLSLSHVRLAADSVITDDAAVLQTEDVEVEAVLGVNMQITGQGSFGGITLGSGTETTVTDSEATVILARLDSINNVTLTGGDIRICYSGADVFNGSEWLAVTLGSVGEEAQLSGDVKMELFWSGREGVLNGYYREGESSTVYFRIGDLVPEPSVLFLSLPMLLGGVLRRRRKS